MALAADILKDLAKQFGTPLYVYDGDLIKQKYQELFENIKYPKLKVLYAMKANYNPAILKILLEAGAGIDAVSPGDVLMARECGFPVERILYTANNITSAEMHEVAETGVLFNIGSLSELRRFGSLFPQSKVCLRINPAVVAGAHVNIQTGGDLTKFGILMDDIDETVAIAKSCNVRIVGLHEHTGSGIKEKEEFLKAVENLLSIANQGRFPDLQFVDFGGGLYVPYHPDDKAINYAEFGAEITTIMEKFTAKFGKRVGLWFEPGKYMVAESGHLLVEVNTLKDNRGRLIVGTNSGFPQLIRPVFYQAYHHVVNLSNPNGKTHTYDVCGNICETGDHFAKDRGLPEIREGDLLDIQNAGAYCYAMGGVYNLRAMPAEVVVKDGKAELTRRRQSTKDLIDSILEECRC